MLNRADLRPAAPDGSPPIGGYNPVHIGGNNGFIFQISALEFVPMIYTGWFEGDGNRVSSMQTRSLHLDWPLDCMLFHILS